MNQTFTNQNELTFTKNYTLISACKKLTPMDKLLVARVLNWQQNGLICTQSNQSLADELGVEVKTLKNTITKLNKTPFFNSKEVSHFNEHGKWSNSKEIIIDEAILFEYVSGGKSVQIQPVQPEAAPEPLKEVHQSEVYPDENKVQETIDITRLFEPFVRDSDGEINDEKFDKLMDVLDVIKKGFRSGSNHYNQAEIKTIYNVLPNQTKILSEDEILQLQELITNLELKAVA